MTKFSNIVTALYLLSVIICIYLAFDFAGSVDGMWTLVLILLTLPWSLFCIFFAWALFHGAGLEFSTFMFTVFAGINAFILWRLFSSYDGDSD
jgi:hypothetical protein